MIKSVLTALAFIHFAVDTTLANKIGREVLATLAAAASAFAIVDIWDWLAVCQAILLGVFSITGASLLYLIGMTEGKKDTRPTA